MSTIKKSKKNIKCQAQELYSRSALFCKAVKYITTKCDYDGWFILSAKYGLLNKTDMVSPYEMTLNKISILSRVFIFS